MIIIEKNTDSVNTCIDYIINEVLGHNSDFAKFVKEFSYYINPTPINIPCMDNNCSIAVDAEITTVTPNNVASNKEFVSLSKHSILSYEDFVKFAIFVVGNHIPTPLKMGNHYNLTIGNNFTSIRFPNNISVSIKVFTSKNSIKYSINIIFHSTPVCEPYIRESDEYKSSIKNGWKVKEDFNKPIKKSI